MATDAHVRPERFADREAIRRVVSASFPSRAEARLVDLLREAGHLTISLVAEVDGAVIGHVALSPVLAADGRRGLGLAPLAVVAEARSRGVGSSLVRAGLSASKEAGYEWVVVLGDPEYYSRFGFRPAPEFGLSDEYGGGTAFQVLALLEGGTPVGGGVVRYGSEFASL